jgi:hypothetical protein
MRDDLGAAIRWDLGFYVFAVAIVVTGVALTRAEEAPFAMQDAGKPAAGASGY